MKGEQERRGGRNCQSAICSLQASDSRKFRGATGMKDEQERRGGRECQSAICSRRASDSRTFGAPYGRFVALELHGDEGRAGAQEHRSNALCNVDSQN